MLRKRYIKSNNIINEPSREICGAYFYEIDSQWMVIQLYFGTEVQ